MRLRVEERWRTRDLRSILETAVSTTAISAAFRVATFVSATLVAFREGCVGQVFLGVGGCVVSAVAFAAMEEILARRVHRIRSDAGSDVSFEFGLVAVSAVSAVVDEFSIDNVSIGVGQRAMSSVSAMSAVASTVDVVLSSLRGSNDSRIRPGTMAYMERTA